MKTSVPTNDASSLLNIEGLGLSLPALTDNDNQLSSISEPPIQSSTGASEPLNKVTAFGEMNSDYEAS